MSVSFSKKAKNSICISLVMAQFSIGVAPLQAEYRGSDLFHQQEILKSLKGLPEAEQNKKLINHYHSQRNKTYYKNIRFYGGILLGEAVVASAAGFLAYKYEEKLKDSGNRGIFSTIISGAFLGGVVLFQVFPQLVQDLVYGFLKTVCPIQPLIKEITNLFSPPLDRLEENRLTYVTRKQSYKEDLQETIEEEFKRFENDNLRYPLSVQLLDIALNLPTSTRGLTFNPQKVDELCTGYNPDLANDLKLFCFRQVLASNGEGDGIAAYLQGPPGTGKTHWAQKLAHALDIPCASVSLEGKTIEDLTGHSLYSQNPKPGILSEALASSKGGSHMVLVIDEGGLKLTDDDQNMQAFLLKFFDPTTKTVHDEFLNADIPISGVLRVITGNQHIKEDSPLSERLQIIPFQGYTAAEKESITYKELLPNILSKTSKNKTNPFYEEDLTPQDHEEIRALIKEDKSPGVRVLNKTLIQYITYKIYAKYQGDREGLSKPLFLKKITQQLQEEAQEGQRNESL
jgi:ATP-dependent Lon protease